MPAQSGKDHHNWKGGRTKHPSTRLQLGELHAVVKAEAARKGVTMTDYIIEAVSMRLEEDTKP